MAMMRVAVLDDSQDVAGSAADWAALEGKAELTVFRDPFASEEDAATKLADFHILVPMRERTAFTASLINRLPALKMIALTGVRAQTLDLKACAARGVLVSNTAGDQVTAATSELAWALVLACARDVPFADAGMRRGGWHGGLNLGVPLAGKRLGIVGLGRLGKRVAAYGKAFGMEVVAWSQNLTAAAAQEAGVILMPKVELFATADVVSLHLVLSERTRHVVGAAEIAALKPGAILVNTARGPLIDTHALLARLRTGTICAGLDVFDEEPLPANHELRQLRNVVMTPHLGYSTEAVFRQFYGEALENVLAFIAGQPIRVVNPA